MANRSTLLEKVNLYKIILSPLNDYNPRLKQALPFLQKLYSSALANEPSCPQTKIGVIELEHLIIAIQQKIKKQENFQAVIQQVSFHTNC